jgi:signal transduction histidine kinase/CheY-like chemotaxis protein
MVSLKHSLSPSASIESELLHLLARQGWMGPIPVLISLGVIAGFSAEHVPVLAWAGWLLLCTVVLFARSTVLIYLPRMNHIAEHRRLRWAIALSAVNGCCHGLSLLFFPYLDELQRAVQTMILTGIGTISVITTAGFLPISIAYLIPTLVPNICLWIAYTWLEEGSWIGYAVAIMALLSNVIMVVLSKDTYELFKESFAIRRRQNEMNIQLKAALQEAEAASRAKTRFLASASHDLRQPIHALSLFGGALAKRPLDEHSRDIAEHMDLALQSLASRLDSLLDISKLDAGIIQVNEAPFNLRLLAERLQDEFMPAARNKSLKVWLHCPDDVFVASDEVLMERIVRNLLSNAIKYTDRGRIDFSVTVASGLVRLQVMDSGQGIPLDEQEHIFEEFYQLNNPERDHAKGLGLGLAIVRRLSDLLKITLELESSPERGSTFTLTMPSTRVEADPVLPDPKVSLSWNNLCALVIDDELEVALGMQALLESMGCKALLADSTETAVQQARRERPDIILADFRLRGEDDGIRSIKSVRGLYGELPAILISGDTAPERLREAENAGIELLHKPVLVQDLELAISEACDLTEAL